MHGPNPLKEVAAHIQNDSCLSIIVGTIMILL